MRLGNRKVYWIAPWNTLSVRSWIFFTNVVSGHHIYRVLGFDVYPSTDGSSSRLVYDKSRRTIVRADGTPLNIAAHDADSF